MDTHAASPPQNGHAVGDLHDLIELVGDENDGVSLLFQVDELLEQLLGLLCRQHGGGFIQDEDECASNQRLDEQARFFRDHAQHHVFGNGKAGDQHEVLMHHADALGDGDRG